MDDGTPGSADGPKPGVPASAGGEAGSAPAGRAGLLASLRALTDGVFGSVQDRLELFSLEVQEEKQRLLRALAWVTVLAGCGLLSVLFASCALVAAFWDTVARLPILGGLAVLYGIAAVVAWRRLRQCVKQAPRPFAATLDELQSDRAGFRPEP